MGGREESELGVFILLAPSPTWSPWAGCVPSLKASVAIRGPLHRHMISVVQKLPFPFGPLGLEVGPMPSLNTAHASRNIPSSSMKCDHASSPAGSPASCLASSCPPVPDPQLCGDWHRLCSSLTPLGSPQGLTHTEYSVSAHETREHAHRCVHTCVHADGQTHSHTLTHRPPQAVAACSLQSCEQSLLRSRWAWTFSTSFIDLKSSLWKLSVSLLCGSSGSA